MKEEIVTAEQSVLEFDEQLEPVVLAQISEVTGSAAGGTGDFLDNVVWGNE